MTPAAKKRAEREKQTARWEAEQARVRALGDLFSAIPAGPQKRALQEAMRDRVIDLYNEAKFEQGDAILEFLPNDYARRLLDWYFPYDDAQTSLSTEAPAVENENP